MHSSEMLISTFTQGICTLLELSILSICSIYIYLSHTFLPLPSNIAKANLHFLFSKNFIFCLKAVVTSHYSDPNLVILNKCFSDKLEDEMFLHGLRNDPTFKMNKLFNACLLYIIVDVKHLQCHIDNVLHTYQRGY